MKRLVLAIALAACSTPDDMLPIQPATGGNVIGKGQPGDGDGTGTLDAGTGFNDGGFGNSDGGFTTDAGEFIPLIDAGTGGTDQIPNDGGTDQIPDNDDSIPDDQTDQIP